MRMNKKGDILVYPVLAGIFIGLTIFYIASITKQPALKTPYIGKLQLDAIKNDIELRKALLYLDTAAKLSAEHALYDIGRNGGFISDSGCGRHDVVYNLWNNDAKECFPVAEKDIKEAFDDKMQSYINNQLGKYTHLTVPMNNYDYYLRQIADNDLEVIGFALVNIDFVKYNISYSIKPSFKVGIDYNVSVYKELKEKANDLIRKCSTSALAGCISNELGSDKYSKWYSGDCQSKTVASANKKAAFCVKESHQFYLYDTSKKKTEKKNVEVKFGLTFMDNVPPLAVDGISIADAPNKENAAVVSWMENKETDVKQYNLYYSSSHFSKVDEAGVVKATNVSDDNDPDANGYSVVIENLNGYDHAKAINSYWFGVTAEDFSGNENKTLTAAVKGDVIDDLAPASALVTNIEKDGANLKITWQPVTGNTDGSAAFDVVKYNVYYSTSDFTSISSASFLGDSTTNTLTKPIAVFGLGNYHFAVTAVDEVPNENTAVTTEIYDVS